MNRHATNPRFEFRVFGQQAERTLAPLIASYPVESRDAGIENYILSATNHQYNCKIRDDKLDVKVLMRRHLGLERWHPYLRIDFPLTAAFLHEFFFAWMEIAPLHLRRKHYTARQFLHEVVMPSSQLYTVQVDKQRRHYSVNGCQVEVSVLWIDGQHQTQTVAVEATDPDVLLHTIELLRLHSFENTNYLVGLSSFLERSAPSGQKLTASSEKVRRMPTPAFVTVR